MQKIVAGVFFLLFTTFAHAQEIPSLNAYVTDQTGTLSASEQRQISQELEQFEQKTSNQVVVVVLSSLNGNEIRDVGRQIFEKNKIGQKKNDNGVLFLIAKNDRKMSIEVGYGLEGALPDAIASQIIRNEVAPQFKQGNFAQGILAGVHAILQATQGEYKGKGKAPDFGLILFWIFFFIIFTSPIWRVLLGQRRNISSRGFRTGFYIGGIGSGGFGGSSWGGGGGGFSGGGGSFGGGGSSGSW